MYSLYDAIKAECDRVGITPSKLFIELGYSKSTISALKLGKSKSLSSDKIAAIADYFGVPMDYFYGKTKTSSEGEAKTIKVPVLGEVAAGFPMFAEENILDWEELPASWEQQGEFFALKIRGDSMAPRILDGDVVIVKKQTDADSGDTAIVLVNGDSATCKKIRKSAEGITLIPINPTFETRFYTQQEIQDLPVQIIGKVVELRGKF